MIPIWIITSSVYQQYPDDDVMLLKRVGYSSDKMIFRRGEVSNDRDGTPLLINDRDEAYRVNDTAVSLWNMCNGINFDDLLHEVMRISSEEESEVRKSLEQMIRQFQEISVVEVKEIKSVSAVRRSGMQT